MEKPVTVATLSERGGDYSDEGYTGEVSTLPVSLDYWRGKAREFQTVLNALDQAYEAARALASLPVDPETVDYMSQAVWEYESRRAGIKAIAEGVNAAAATINAMGGRMPSLSIPQTLGVPPLVIGAGALAALGAMGAAIVWGREWIIGVNQRAQSAQLLDAMTPDNRSQAAAAALQIQTAANVSSDSPFSAIAGYVKWGAIALAAWLAYRAVKGSGMLKSITDTGDD
jgi:hypothetical protein